VYQFRFQLLLSLPFGEVEARYRDGRIDREDWLRYCHEWRLTPRFTNLGLREANEYRRLTGLREEDPEGVR